FFFQAEDGIRDWSVTGVQTCALPILRSGLPLSVKVTVPVAPELTFAVKTTESPRFDGVGAAIKLVVVAKRVTVYRSEPGVPLARSEERRVGKEGRWRGGADEEREKRE